MRWAASSAAGHDLAALLDRVLSEITDRLAGARVDAAFVFLGPEHAPRAPMVRDRLRSAWQGAPLLGCTAFGVLGGGREHEQPGGLAVTAAHLPDVEVRTFHVEHDALPDPDAPPSAWHAVVGAPAASQPCFVLVADPHSISAESLVGGLDFAYPSSVKVGGLASGADGPGEQVLFEGERLHRSGAVGMTLAGDVALVPAVAQGCRPFGPAMRVTSCDGRLLKTLDDEPALDAVQRVLREADERDRGLARSAALFLGVETDPFAAPRGADGPWLVRNLLGRERDGGGLFVGETLRTGRRVRLHVRDRAASVEDLEVTLGASADSVGSRCAGALLFSCVGRGMSLYGVPDHDTRAFHARFSGTPLGGFFCSGEIGPVGGSTHLHGFTSSFGLFLPKRR